MKATFRYFFALCLLIGYNQLLTKASVGDNFISIPESQQNWENSGEKISGNRQLVISKSPLTNVAEISNLVESKIGTEEENPYYLNLGPYFSTSFLSLTKASYLYYSSFSSFFKKYLAFSTCRRYLLFEVFRI